MCSTDRPIFLAHQLPPVVRILDDDGTELVRITRESGIEVLVPSRCEEAAKQFAEYVNHYLSVPAK